VVEIYIRVGTNFQSLFVNTAKLSLPRWRDIIMQTIGPAFASSV